MRLAVGDVGQMKFNCGCCLPDAKNVDWDSVPMDCPATWQLIGDGLTKGVFQLEESLGRRWSKKIKPTNLGELSDVISLIRPGCLKAEFREDPRTGKMISISDTYVVVRNGELPIEYIHESLEPILKSTYGVPVYQEQLMDICKDFAGWSLEEADDLRKAVGKKDTAKMVKLESRFIEGAVAKGYNEAVAKTIFGWINEFSGYGFNKSHGVCYALLSYHTAYAKVHFPIEFFKNMLENSDSKIDEFDEIKQLVYEAKLFNIEVVPPTVRQMNKDFAFLPGNKLAFGIAHIKNVGESSMEAINKLAEIESEDKLMDYVITLANTKPPKKPKKEPDEAEAALPFVSEEEKPAAEPELLKVKSNVMEALIKCGALDYLTKNRIRMLARYKMLSELTPREFRWIVDNGHLSKSSDDWLSLMMENKVIRQPDKRYPKIKEHFDLVKKDLGGNAFKLKLGYEKFHLGMTLSGSEVELYNNVKANTTCRDFLKLRDGEVAIASLIEDVRVIQDKNHNQMAFLNLSDHTYMLDNVVVFASTYPKVAWILEPGKVALVKGRKKDSTLLVNSIEHL
jgi:DNA polymerase III alpha subunit